MTLLEALTGTARATIQHSMVIECPEIYRRGCNSLECPEFCVTVQYVQIAEEDKRLVKTPLISQKEI